MEPDLKHRRQTSPSLLTTSASGLVLGGVGLGECGLVADRGEQLAGDGERLLERVPGSLKRYP